MGFVTVQRLAALAIVCASASAQSSHTLVSNFEYRQEWGDLGAVGSISATPTHDRRAVLLTGDIDTILNLCLTSPDWRKDRIYTRLAHNDWFSTVSCRNKQNPSLHTVFYKRQDGTREAWAHFDLHGPQNTWMHATEVVRNRMTFGRTSQLDVYRSLVQEKTRLMPPEPWAPAEFVPPGRYDYKAQAKRYLRNIVGPSAITATVALGSSGATMRQMLGAGATGDRHLDRIGYALAQNATLQSVEFGFSAFLHQDETFRPSGKTGVGKRSAKALLHTVVAPGRDGPEVAFPRIAAAMLTPRVLYGFHPGLSAPVASPWQQTAFLMGRYMLRSFWVEFKPDLTRALRRSVPEFLR